MRLCLIFVVALLLVASSCVDLTEPVPTQPECTANRDCDDGDICTTDECSNSTCRNTPVDCPSGTRCLPPTGDCVVTECTSDADCDDGVFCNGLEFCQLTERSCADGASPCEAGQTCNEETDRCDNISCFTSADCAPGQICNISGRCVSP